MALAIALALLPIAWFIIEKQKVQLICEKQILQSQEHLVSGENQLIRLNIPVRALVLQKKTLQNAVATAPTPPVKAALLAQLMIVIGEIRGLRLRQQFILKMYEARAQGSLMVLQTSVRKEVQNIQRTLTSLATSRATVTSRAPLFTFVNLPLPRMQLLPVFIDPLIPIYEAPPALPVLQTLRAHIEIRGRRFFPDWLEFLKSKSFHWEEFCSSHPRTGGFQWESYLGVGRSF